VKETASDETILKPHIRLPVGWNRHLFCFCLNLLRCTSLLLVVEMCACCSGLAYTLGNLYRDQFVIPKSELTSILLAAYYLQFAELKNKCVSTRYISVEVDLISVIELLGSSCLPVTWWTPVHTSVCSRLLDNQSINQSAWTCYGAPHPKLWGARNTVKIQQHNSVTIMIQRRGESLV